MTTTTATCVTERVLRQATDRGLRPCPRADGQRIAYLLSQPDEQGTFGVIYVGARSGRILETVLYRGNDDPVGTRYRGARAAARAIRDTPPVTLPASSPSTP